jgi:hypothetical protein
LAVEQGSGDLDEIANSLSESRIENLLEEADRDKVILTSAALVALDQAEDLTATVLVRGLGQETVGIAVSVEVFGCVNMVFVDGQLKDPEISSEPCPEWTRDYLMTAAQIELTP